MKLKVSAFLSAGIILFCSCGSKSESGDETNGTTDTIPTIITQDTTHEISEQDHTAIKTNEADEIKYTYQGVVMQKGGTWIIRAKSGNDETDFYPKNLEKKYAVEGLEVQFNGVAEEIPKNARMVGRPITITAIEKL